MDLVHLERVKKFAGPTATSVLGWFSSSTIDQNLRPQALELQLWGGKVRLPCCRFSGANLLVFCQKTIFIFIAKVSKKRGLWETKMVPKIEFFELWRLSVSDLDFSSFFFNFAALGLGTFVKDF